MKTLNVANLTEFRALLGELPGPDKDAQDAALAREPQLTKPPGSLGRLERFAAFLSRWQAKHPPTLERPHCAVFAGNHGVATLGVSAYPPEVTVQMVANFEHGGAAINQLCKANGIALRVEALDLDTPTADFTKGAAMTEAECVSALNAGLRVADEAAASGADLLCLGEMGIANTTPAAALCHALYGRDAAFWTGPGTGVEGDALSFKARVVADAVALHKPHIGDGIDALRFLGGRELAAIAGAVVGARLKRIPVVLDGYVCTAAAAPLEATHKGALDHCLIGHASAEPGHVRLLGQLGKTALLEMGMRLGEGSGAALAVGILKGAVACHTGMATFAEAGVTDKE